MNVVTRLSLVLLIASVATLAVAADPEPQAPATPPASSERTPAPALNINQAELEAGVATEPAAAAKAGEDGAALSPMMVEIQATLDQSRAAIGELSERAASAPDHAASVVIQQEIAVAKQQAELDVLGIQARYARANGDEALAQQIEAAIAAIVSPPAPVAPTETRPAPDNQN